MKLTDLEATFIGNWTDGGKSWRELPTVDGAQGVAFICPKCQSHSILCLFTNPRNAPAVPATDLPGPGRWTFTGETIDTLTLTPSVDLSKPPQVGCLWHGHVKQGSADSDSSARNLDFHAVKMWGPKFSDLVKVERKVES